ncbi:MAG TPA: hypothetical protein VIR65_11655 [Rhizorhapis sp.]
MNVRIVMVGLVAAIGIAAVVAAVVLVDPPWQERQQRSDEIRQDNLQQIDEMILSYQREHKVLPESFEALSRYSHRMLPTDPETGAPYAYEVLSQSSYRLCANFRAERRAETGPLLNPSPFAFHPAGEKCFLLEVKP